MCLSKGLGCPIGSIVAGTHKEIQQARVFRKMLGGSMRQTGLFASCGLVALEDWEEKIAEDNANTRYLAHELFDIKSVDIDHH